ncbi:MAG: sporulation protein [Clostridia bacterium]|nr:sporulation protein [Clostridia bacterium]
MELSTDKLDVLFSKLQNFVRTETIVGTPIYLDRITLIPLVRVSFGLGTGSSCGEEGEKNSMEGLGAGATIIPHTVLIVVDNQVSVLPLNDKNKIDKILDMAPGWLDGLKRNQQNKK